jgi:glycosyltransferase involved in cell wall biosynthesis
MPKELKHLLLATTEDPFNIKSWSGIPFSLRSALERQVERVTVFRPPPPRRAPLDVAKRVIFGAKKFPLWITSATLRQNARALEQEIARTHPDAILSISSQSIIHLPPQQAPVLLFSDAPYLAFSETYAQWETPPRRVGKFAQEEAAAARRLDGLCFGSAWACAEASRLYNLGSDARLHVTPLGSNWVPNLSSDQILQRIDERIGRLASEGLELLFLGRDWERKGGPLAVKVARLLHASGHKVRLHVVGCRPELAADTGTFVSIHGPLFQTDPQQSAQLAELFLRSHFLLVPTLAECFGIAFAEAQGFGLPPISRAVHAVPSIILDGQTGLLFDRDAPAADYVARIAATMARPGEYLAMARHARQWFEERLTWDRTAERMISEFSRLLTWKPSPR